MLKFYIDDGNIMSTKFPLGSRLCEDGKIRVIEDEIESDRNIPGDKRTAELYLQKNPDKLTIRPIESVVDVSVFL